MKRVIRHIALLLTLLGGATLVGCETPVEFSGEEMEPLPVIYSVVSPDEPVKVYYSASVFILDEEYYTLPYVTNGVVELYINDRFVERMPYTEIVEEEPPYTDPLTGDPVGNNEPSEPTYRVVDRCYLSSTTPKVGDKVTIRACSPKFPSWVSGTTTIPEPPVLGELSADRDGIDEDGYIYGRAYIRISDPADRIDYYWLQGSLSRQLPDNNYTRPSYFDYTDPSFGGDTTNDVISDIVGDATYDYALFDDALFDGLEEHPLRAEWSLYQSAFEGTSPYFEARCCRLSEDLYKYYRSVELTRREQLFGEPVQIHSNIEGGLGVVGSRSTYTVVRKDYQEAVAR